jgi:hypothetical protein
MSEDDMVSLSVIDVMDGDSRMAAGDDDWIRLWLGYGYWNSICQLLPILSLVLRF